MAHTAEWVLDRALRAGASDAEVVAYEGDEFNVHVRLGEVEQLTEEGSVCACSPAIERQQLRPPT